MSLAERTVSTSSGRALTLLYKEHAADAFRYLGEGHAQGKIVLTV